jgi:ABC-type transporter Mla subunit MlaD
MTMAVIDISTDELARIRAKFTRMSEVAGPLLAEVQEASRRGLANVLAEVTDTISAAQTEAGAVIRRTCAAVDDAMKCMPATLTDVLAEHRWADDGGPVIEPTAAE